MLHALQVALRVAAIRLQHGDPAALLLRGGLRLPDRITDLIRLQVAVVEVERQGFRGDIELVQRVVLLLQDEGGGMIVLLGLARRGAQALERLQPQRNLKALELLTVGQVALRLLCLIAQRANLQLQLRDLVADAGQIVLRRGEAALRFLFAVAVFRDTGGLLENFAAVRALEGQNFVDASLACRAAFPAGKARGKGAGAGDRAAACRSCAGEFEGSGEFGRITEVLCCA